MTLSTLFSALLYLLGIAAVIVGTRSLLSRAWSPHLELHPPSKLRRDARKERIDAARERGLYVVGDRRLRRDPSTLPIFDGPDPKDAA